MGTMPAIQAVLAAVLDRSTPGRRPSSACAGRGRFPAARTAGPACRTSRPGCSAIACWCSRRNLLRHDIGHVEPKRRRIGVAAAGRAPRRAASRDPMQACDDSVYTSMERRGEGETEENKETRSTAESPCLPCLLALLVFASSLCSIVDLLIESSDSAAEGARRHDDFDFFDFVGLERDDHAAAVRPFQLGGVGRGADQAVAGCARRFRATLAARSARPPARWRFRNCHSSSVTAK